MPAKMEVFGLSRFVRATKGAMKEVDRATANALRRGLRPAAAEVRKNIRENSGLGRKIWGKNGSGLESQKLVVALLKVRFDSGTVTCGIRMRGIPALIDGGGRTKKHVIKPWRSKGAGARLAFVGTKGLVMPRQVNHPGSTVRAHHFAEQAIQRNQAGIEREVAEAATAALKGVLLGTGEAA